MNRKSAYRVIVTEAMEMAPKTFHLSSTAGTTILSPFISMPPCSCLQCGISVVENISLDVTVLFSMYIDKLLCSNSDRNKEAIRD